MFKSVSIAPLVGLLLLGPFASAQEIIHDAEYAIIEAQNGEAWAADDKVLDEKLAEIRANNRGKPPNIVYILLDDVGFGEIGMDNLSVIRGYKTPNISALASQGMSLNRMYTEPSCTPTRVAMMTGRYPTRTGLTEAKATLAGDGVLGVVDNLAASIESGKGSTSAGSYARAITISTPRPARRRPSAPTGTNCLRARQCLPKAR